MVDAVKGTQELAVEEVFCDALADEVQVVVDEAIQLAVVQEVGNTVVQDFQTVGTPQALTDKGSPSPTIVSPSLSFAEVVRGSPSEGSPGVPASTKLSESTPKGGGSGTQIAQGRVSGISPTQVVLPILAGKGKQIWIDESQTDFQVVKKGGKGGKGKKRK
ncbi:unnamed protein product [Linum trigynum]|uniref:Uncharacterized protein n=1 Tax=Linum trigynum TaxID=586398 RepID=A0AAV2DY47_9ROSI